MKSPEELTQNLKEALGDNLRSVVLYGSAAANDQTKKYSDINVLVVVEKLDVASLNSVMPVTRKWNKAGNPAPLFFTEERIRQAGDVFPVEFTDIKSARRVLYGTDLFAEFPIQLRHLRHQLEYELRGKLIHLRERYLETGGKNADVQALLAKAMSAFVVLFKGVLRLAGEEPPKKKAEVIAAIGRHVKMDADALQTILLMRENDKDALKENPEILLSGLLSSVENVIDFVDQQEEKK